MKKFIFFILFILVIGGIVTGSVLLKEEKEKKKVECNDCVNTYDFKSDSAKILLGNKIREVKVKKENNKETLVIGDKALKTLDEGKSFYNIYVFNNEAILVTIDGDTYRNIHTYFYDKDLKLLDVDMTLDKDYPKSMVMFSSDDIEVEDNKIFVYGSRVTSEVTLVDEDLNETKLCVNSGKPTTYTDTHTGELLSAKYEIEYLGNSKFSSANKVLEIKKLDETICYYE